MKDFVYIINTMHETSVRIFERKKASLYSSPSGAEQNGSERAEGDLGPVIRGKDIMSVLRMFTQSV